MGSRGRCSSDRGRSPPTGCLWPSAATCRRSGPSRSSPPPTAATLPAGDGHGVDTALLDGLENGRRRAPRPRRGRGRCRSRHRRRRDRRRGRGGGGGGDATGAGGRGVVGVEALVATAPISLPSSNAPTMSAGAYNDAIWFTAVFRLVPAVRKAEARARAAAANPAASVVGNASADDERWREAMPGCLSVHRSVPVVRGGDAGP